MKSFIIILLWSSSDVFIEPAWSNENHTIFEMLALHLAQAHWPCSVSTIIQLPEIKRVASHRPMQTAKYSL